MTAVVPRLPAAKQRSEVSVKNPERPRKPSSTMARLKWVASTGGWMWRGFPENLKTPWRSPYKARGISQHWISPSIRVK